MSLTAAKTLAAVLLILMVASLGACKLNQLNTKQETKELSMSLTAAEILATVYQRMGEQDWDGVMALLSDDFKVVEPKSLPYGGVWEGKDALLRLYPAVMSNFDDPAPVIKEVIGGEVWAAVIVDFTVTSKKTGRRFTQTVSEVGRIEDGKLAELQIHYFDTAELVEEIGGPSE